MSFIKEYVKQPRILLSLILKECGFWISDKWYLQMKYYLETGKILHLSHPKTFGDKIQWLKLYDRRPEYTMMVDKYAVKDFVARIIGKEYVIPTIGVWDKPEDINFDSLPHQFVLKTTHGGGSCGVILCRDKALMDKERIVNVLRSALKNDIYKPFREWPYKDVPRRIIAEPYINDSFDSNQELTDYKFYCFNGIPKYCQVIKDRRTKETIDFFDMDWYHQTFYGLNPVYGLVPDIEPAETEPAKPVHLEIMKEIATILSAGLYFSRIDLYDTNDGPRFGEITLYPASGIGTFTPSEYNTILGEMIKLPNR